ncbi:MAG TPA: class I SAM-dependent methyltransferase [Bryobacteraceae bacterium]|nr:class I SAM-dependent methyltransferase [Bryobacteraceae bacterium]
MARQKRQAHLELVARWANKPAGRLVKTDLFEEANGADQLLFDLRHNCDLAIGFDSDLKIVKRALLRSPDCQGIRFLGGDARALPLRSGCIDVVVSSSTLDHFQKKSDFGVALQELARVLRPGGVLILTLDNPLNPLYWPLRCLSFAGPFRLGYTPFPSELRRQLGAARLEVIGSASLIHNPRVISTLLFLAIRRVLGRRADPVIQGLLRCFAALGSLPTRRFTGCFYAVAARRLDPD